MCSFAGLFGAARQPCTYASACRGMSCELVCVVLARIDMRFRECACAAERTTRSKNVSCDATVTGISLTDGSDQKICTSACGSQPAASAEHKAKHNLVVDPDAGACGSMVTAVKGTLHRAVDVARNRTNVQVRVRACHGPAGRQHASQQARNEHTPPTCLTRTTTLMFSFSVPVNVVCRCHLLQTSQCTCRTRDGHF